MDDSNNMRMILAGDYAYRRFRHIWGGWKLWIETKGKRGTKPPSRK